MTDELRDDRKRQVETTKARHGEDHFKKIGQKGGQNNPLKFNSETAKAAAERRWAKHRAEQSKEKKGEQ